MGGRDTDNGNSTRYDMARNEPTNGLPVGRADCSVLQRYRKRLHSVFLHPAYPSGSGGRGERRAVRHQWRAVHRDVHGRWDKQQRQHPGRERHPLSYLGSWAIDDALTFYANTTRFDTGAATDADSVPSYRVYEDETTSPLLTGSMALLDSANTAGFYSEQIALSAANGFEAGKQYAIYIAATVNLVAGASHHTFQVGAKVNTMAWNSLATVALPLVPTVAGRALDVSAAGEAGGDWADVGTPGSTVALSATTVKTATDVETDTADIQSNITILLARIGAF